MTTDIRAALERLLQHIDDPIRTTFTREDAIAAARAALAAEPVGEGPSDEELYDLADEYSGDVVPAMLAALTRWGRPAVPVALPPNYIDPEHQGADLKLLEAFYGACNAEGGTADEIHLRGIRAVLAARPAAPAGPVEGEIGELVDRLGWTAAQLGDIGWTDDSASVARAAVLLQWRTDGPAVPESREPASVAPEAKPTYSDRLALAMCPYIAGFCKNPANDCRHYCRRDSAAVAHEIAQILRERHGGSSTTADWLDGVGAG